MGNVESADAFSGVDELKEALSDLETRLASIEAGHRQALRDAELDAANMDGPGGLRPSDASLGGGGLIMCGATLRCDRAVRIVVGPIIGKVTGDRARVLLEVDKDTEVACHVCLVDDSCPQGRQVAEVRMRMRARRPGVFQLAKLVPGERYVACFSGVCRDDAVERVADFQSLPLHDHELRFLAVSGDRPEAVVAGEFNLWETIFERVRQRHLPRVGVMIHSGGQVHMQQAFEDAWVLLRRHAEYMDTGAGVDTTKGGEGAAWIALEEEAAERLRAAYRFSWNLPFTRETLASVPHLMVPADCDIYPNFNRHQDLFPETGGFVGAAMLRLCRRVYWEYQRQLWDPAVPEMIAEDEEKVSVTHHAPPQQ